MEHIRSLYEKYREQNSNLTLLEEFETLFESIAKALSHTYIVIDGIDEIAEREHFLALILRLQRLDNVNVLVVSRPLQDVEKCLSHALKLRIETDMVNEDIRTYIKLRIHRDSKLQSIKSSLKDEVEAKLFNQSEGMSLPWHAQVNVLGFDGCNANWIISVV